jgi:hypothetical protein
MSYPQPRYRPLLLLCYRIAMNKEKPKGTNYRFYKKQIRKVKAAAKKLTKAEGKTVSEAEVARRAVDAFTPTI